MRKLTLALALALASSAALKSNAETDASGMQTAHQFHFAKTKTADVNYLLYLPRGYDAKASTRWPLILFLHGAGERGTDIWKVATHGPPKNATNLTDFPFVVVSPQCPDGQIWSNDALLALLDEVVAQHKVDTNRVYLTGLSMGGYGSWNLGLEYPHRFAAIVPICGGGQMISVLLSSREKADALKSLGVWAFHGAKDTVVPLEESQRMVEALKRVGVKEVKFTVYPDANHDSWTVTYKNPELYQWLLAHDRSKQAR